MSTTTTTPNSVTGVGRSNKTTESSQQYVENVALRGTMSFTSLNNLLLKLIDDSMILTKHLLVRLQTKTPVITPLMNETTTLRSFGGVRIEAQILQYE